MNHLAEGDRVDHFLPGNGQKNPKYPVCLGIAFLSDAWPILPAQLNAKHI
jgi:hypothetical protein